MGGWNSGRSGGRPTVENGKTIDLALLLRKGWMRDGHQGFRHQLIWSSRGEPNGNISYDYDMTDPEAASMTLRFSVTRHRTGEKTDHVQTVRLSYTVPHYGGRRWWMHCPVTGARVGKLHVPANGDIFASRKAWGMGYHSQRVAHGDRPFERLFALQKSLDCQQGWQAYLFRPKGMWRRTFDRHMDRYWQLDEDCSMAAMGMVNRMHQRLGAIKSRGR